MMKANSRLNQSPQGKEKKRKSDIYKQTDNIIQLTESVCTYRKNSFSTVQYSDREISMSALQHTHEITADKSSFDSDGEFLDINMEGQLVLSLYG